MTNAMTRRALFSRLRGGPPQIRPPWSRHEERFTAACTQCGKCIEACPTGIIARGHAGYPIVLFEQDGCTFCGKCVAACEAGCFDRGTSDPWLLKAAISPACVEAKGVSCRMCADACDARAIAFRPRLGGGAEAAISLDDCTGCGACVAPCPVKAITIAIHHPMETTA